MVACLVHVYKGHFVQDHIKCYSLRNEMDWRFIETIWWWFIVMGGANMKFFVRYYAPISVNLYGKYFIISKKKIQKFVVLFLKLV